MHKKVEKNNFAWYNINKSFVFERDVNMGKLLVKYDVRGIQAFVFRTNKLKEIRAVSDLPERIIKEAANEALADLKIEKEIEWLDTAGGNAVAVFDTKEEFEAVSTRMAVKVLEKTYSLKLVYACIMIDTNQDFHEQYENLNKQLGKLKAAMPEPTHTGAFPVCRQDYLTGFPVSVVKEEYGKKVFLTPESVIKLKEDQKKRENPRLENEYDDVSTKNVLDDLIFEKGVDSHIAVIHIDGNNMGNRINEIIKKNAKFDADGGFETIKSTFKSITVAEEFKKVCQEVKEIITEYKKQTGTDQPLIYSVIAAGDDITYVTRANIALPFTKLFLKKISEHDMYSKSDDHNKYGINACAGIAFIKSHFPFSDAYELAERCCSSAKKRAKSDGIADKNNVDNPFGNWIDFEICTHIKNTELERSRQKYGVTTDANGDKALLLVRPYCVGTENKSNEFFDYNKFERRISELDRSRDSQCGIYNRSRAKSLRQAYTDGGAAIENFKNAAESRDYMLTEKELFCFDDTTKENYAVYYDATDIMDLVDTRFMKYVNGIIENGGEKG